MNKKVVKLVDRRGCPGSVIGELRSTIREIQAGEIVGIGMVTIRRDKTGIKHLFPSKGRGR